MYPVEFKGWLRLRVALVVFLAGSISLPLVYALGLSSEWYSQVPIALVAAGMAYLFLVGEWQRVLYKRRRDPETRPRIVRDGTTLFLAGLITPVILNLPPIEDLVDQFIPSTSLQFIGGVMISIGAVTVTWGIFDNCKKLPARVEKSARNAMRMMKEAGCEIHDDPLWVGLDPRLQSAARTYPAEGGSVILVKPKYVDTQWLGGLDNILVHEMSHIYRRETNHPSENPEILKDFEARYKTFKNYTRKSYQLKTLIGSAFNLEEILTDDLAFRVLEKSKVAWVEPTEKSLQALIRSKPAWALRSRWKRWKNVMLIAGNSMWIAEMDRNKIPDTGDKAKSANQKLLSALPEEASRAYEHLHRLALDLRENVTVEEFKTILGDYAATIVEFAEGQTGKASTITGP